MKGSVLYCICLNKKRKARILQPDPFSNPTENK